MAKTLALEKPAKKKLGRPSTLTWEIVEKAKTYLAWNEQNPVELERIVNPATREVIQAKTFPRFPSYAGLACYLGVSKDTTIGWGDLLSDEGKEIRSVLDEVKCVAERMLLETGFAGKGNVLFTKFMLSAGHGYREKNETDITSGGKPLAILGGLTQKE